MLVGWLRDQDSRVVHLKVLYQGPWTSLSDTKSSDMLM